MTMLPLLTNILGQPQSLQKVLRHAAGPSRESLDEAATLLRNCRGRIVITGMGASFFASMPAQYTLEQAGFHTLYLESSELLHNLSGALHEGDVAILVSRSGDSVEVASLLPELKRKGIPTMGVTNEPNSTLARDSGICLLLHSAADQMVAIQTYAATVLILSMLAAVATGQTLNELITRASEALPALEGLIATCLTAAPTWRTFLAEASPLYLLGRGLSLTTVTEGALLFHETAKAAVVPMSCAQFRHGPVEVVTPGFRAILLASAGRTLAFDIGLANDLISMGAEVLWIGSEASTPTLATHVQRMATLPPHLAPWLTPLFEVVPLQLAAYELARLRDIVPGSFRYTPQVTTSELGFASVAQAAIKSDTVSAA